MKIQMQGALFATLLFAAGGAHAATWECGGWATAPSAIEACQRYYDFEYAQGRLSSPRVVTGIGSAGCTESNTVYGPLVGCCVSIRYWSSYDGRYFDVDNNTCARTQSCRLTPTTIEGTCSTTTAYKQPPSPSTCNPIALATGNKWHREQDIRTGGSGAKLEFSRYFNGMLDRLGGPRMSSSWTHSFSSWLLVNPFKPSPLYMFRPSGQMFVARSPGAPTAAGMQLWTVDTDVNERAYAQISTALKVEGWKVITATGDVEIYDAGGKLLSVQGFDGQSLSVGYSDGTTGPGGGVVLDATWAPTTMPLPANLLVRVTDNFGRQLVFDYDAASRLVQVTDPSGQKVRFSSGANGSPATVTYPDGRSKTYHYGETAFTGGANLPNALTGISDESGVRFASYWYNTAGQAISETHWADGAQSVPADQYAITYGSNQSTVTDARNTQRLYSFISIWDVLRQSSQSQPGGSGCGPSASALTYDANANVSSRTDFNGVKTCYAYDLSRNLETKRVEGVAASTDCAAALTSPPAGARVISTQWHPDWRLETKIAEPSKITTITYNGQGATCAPSTVLVDGKPPAVVCSRSEQATTDPTGSLGFGAGLSGTARTWSTTYTTYGRVLTAIDPNGKVASTSYYADDDPDLGRRGNVATFTNAANHVTRITAYSLNGQRTQIVDPNGLTTDLTYDLRMRLTSRKVGSELTTFTYDPRGLLTNVTLPDGAGVTYTYDAAHRLIAIADQQGNRIDYTLDAMDNRIAERATDSGGTLVRNLQRTLDALNRVQQVTGMQ